LSTGVSGVKTEEGVGGVGGVNDCGGEFAGVEDVEGDYRVAHYALGRVVWGGNVQ
jgi:hypothetical protein